MKRVLMAMLVFAVGVQGQESGPPTKTTVDTIEVVGQRAKLGKEVQSFVSTVTALDGELVSSWVAQICPKVVAENQAHAQYIRERILEVAAEIPLKADADSACRANLFVIVTGRPENFIAEWKERDPGMFMWRPRRGVTRSPDSLPVRTWHNVALEPADGDVGCNVSSVGSRLSQHGETACFRSKASRIRSGVSENLQSVLVLVDANKVAGTTLRQLADYIALVSLSKVDLTADFSKSDSILRLFESDSLTERPRGLTTWDRAFLRGLYRQSYEAVNQRMAIANRMVRDLVENPTHVAQP